MQDCLIAKRRRLRLAALFVKSSNLSTNSVSFFIKPCLSDPVSEAQELILCQTCPDLDYTHSLRDENLSDVEEFQSQRNILWFLQKRFYFVEMS